MSAAATASGKPALPLRITLRPPRLADAEAIAAVRFSAFSSSCISRTVFPGGSTPDQLAAAAKKARETLEGGGKDTEFWELATVPKEGGAEGEEEVIGYTRWLLELKPREPAEWDVLPGPATEAQYGKGTDLNMATEFFTGIYAMHNRNAKGDPHAHLLFIATRPEYQGSGAGTLLMRSGLARIDALRSDEPRPRPLAVWLQASPAGYRMYEKCGFRPVDAFDFEICPRHSARVGGGRRADEDWGAGKGAGVPGVPELREGWHRTVLMKREPVEVDGEEKV